MLPVLAGALLAYFGLKLLVPVLVSRAILDHPEDRRNHETPTPRGGGLAVEHEDIEIIEYSLPEAWQALAAGQIVDAKTLIALMWLREKLKEQS